MNTADISLWVLGILISILLTYWGIVVSRKTVKKTSLCLVENLTISLLNQFKDKFSSVVVEYNKQPIEKNLVYFEFGILNNGSNDINKSQIYKPLEVILPEDYKFIESRINRVSNNDLVCNTHINNNTLTIDWDLLKPNEFFILEVIVDSPKSISSLSKQITFNHRITDLNNINKFDLSHPPKTTIKLKKRGIASSLLVGFMAGTFFMLMATVGLNNILDDASKYSIDSKLFNKINRKEVKLSATKPGIFIIKENDNQIDTATAKTINYKIFTIHSIKYNSNITPSIFLIIFGVGMLIISTVGTTMDIKGKMKDISLLKLLDIIKK